MQRLVKKFYQIQLQLRGGKTGVKQGKTQLARDVLQANYQLVLPNIRDYLYDIGAVMSMAGVVIGCCDIASIPGTIGIVPLPTAVLDAALL